MSGCLVLTLRHDIGLEGVKVLLLNCLKTADTAVEMHK